MEYLDLMRELNLDVAGEFMVMAATLIHIKSKMLVPVEPTEAEGEEETEDPRAELVRRLARVPALQGGGGHPAPAGPDPGRHLDAARHRAARGSTTPGEEMLEAGLFDLIAAFKELLERRKTLLAHEVEAEGKSIEERMEELLALIKEGESLEFLELFAAQETKGDMIVTFLALLELIRLKRVKVYQRGIFGADPGLPAGGAGGRPRAASRRGSMNEDDRDQDTKRRPGKTTSPEDEATERRGRASAAEASRRTRARSCRRAEVKRRARGAHLRLAPARSPRARSPRCSAASPRRPGRRRSAELQAEYARDGRGLQIVEVAGGYQITTRPEYNDWVRELLDPQDADPALDPGPRDAGRHRLQAAGHPARDHRPARREVGRRDQDAPREAPHPDHRAARRSWAGPCSTAPPSSSSSTSASRTSAELPKIEEFAEVLGEEVDVAGLKRAIEAPTPVDVPLAEGAAGGDEAADDLPDGSSSEEAADDQADGSSGEGSA